MNETFAQNLKSLRKQHHLSQQQLADHLNVHIGSITKWEKNGVRPRAQKIDEIAEFFNITPDELRGTILSGDGTRKRLSKTELKKHKTIGQKIKALREHSDLNYTDLGKSIGATSYTVSKWEKEISKPYNDVIQRLADFFNVEFEELSGEPRKSNPVGERIRNLRQEQEISRDELSEKIGMSSQSIHSWEQGNSVPRTRALHKLAEAFNVELDDLLGNTKEEEVEEVAIMNEIMEEVHEDATDIQFESEALDEEADATVSHEALEDAEWVAQTSGFEPKILEFTNPSLQNNRTESTPSFVPVAISRENEIIDLEVLFTAANKRLVLGQSLLNDEEKMRALNVLAAVFNKGHL